MLPSETLADMMKTRQDKMSCIEALESAHIHLVNAAVDRGWGERQVAQALLELAEFHVALLGESDKCPN